MTLTNLLPCAIHILVSEQGSVELDRAEGSSSRVDADAQCAPELEVRLDAGASSELHVLHVLTPLRLRLWIGAPSYDQAPSPNLTLTRALT